MSEVRFDRRHAFAGWVIGALVAAAHGADNAVPARDTPSTRLSGQGTDTMNIRLTINGKALTATLVDNATARDFLSLLPMTLTLEDYAATEKISYLPRKLSTAGAPEGTDASAGDIAYYAPWGNLAIFYKDFPVLERPHPAGSDRFRHGLADLVHYGNGWITVSRRDSTHGTAMLVLAVVLSSRSSSGRDSYLLRD